MTYAERKDRDRSMTIADLQALPEAGGYRVELVRGRFVRSPRPSVLHGRLVVRLGFYLHAHVEATGAGVVVSDAGVVLGRNPDTVRGPDLAFFSTARMPETGYAARYWGPPDIAVEITSPSNRIADMAGKIADYLDAGVGAVWVIDPRQRSVAIHQPPREAHTRHSDDILVGGELLPGFRLPLSDLFAT